MQLKPHDLVVALKLALTGPLTYDRLAASLDLSKSEAHAAVKRAKAAGLLRADRQPVHHAILEFVVHGVRYAFPAVRGRQARGMPTSYAAPPRNTSLCRSGASRSTTRRSIAILSEMLSPMDQPGDMVCCEISFPSPAATQGIDEAQALVEFGIDAGCGRCRWVERVE